MRRAFSPARSAALNRSSLGPNRNNEPNTFPANLYGLNERSSLRRKRRRCKPGPQPQGPFSSRWRGAPRACGASDGGRGPPVAPFRARSAAARRSGFRCWDGSRTDCPCPVPLSGLMMNICAVAGFRSAALIGNFVRGARDLAQRGGQPQRAACRYRRPSRSASYSRERLIAIWMMPAASGARNTISSVPMMPMPPFLLRLPPPNNMPKLASMEMAPPSVAAMVMVSVSRFFTCASSCAMTPATSSRVSRSACRWSRRRRHYQGCGRWRRRSAGRLR